MAGFWLLPWLGERWASVVLAIPLFIWAGLIALRKQSYELDGGRSRVFPKFQFAIAAALAIFLVRVSHDYGKKYPKRQVRRDYTATVIAAGKGFSRELLVNGIGMTGLTPVTKYMAHLPLAFMGRTPAERLGNLLWDGNDLPINAFMGGAHHGSRPGPQRARALRIFL